MSQLWLTAAAETVTAGNGEVFLEILTNDPCSLLDMRMCLFWKVLEVENAHSSERLSGAVEEQGQANHYE